MTPKQFSYPKQSNIEKYRQMLELLDPVKYPPTATLDPFKQKYSDIHSFIFMDPKPEEPKPIPKPTTAIITERDDLKVLYYNVNSLQSVERQNTITMGILKDKPDVAIFAETKADPNDPEFQIHGYWMVKNLARKGGAGGMMVLARNEINVTNEHAKSVVKEIQVINFKVEDHLIIAVYRSPNAIGNELNHHEKLIQHLTKLLNNHPPGDPFTITGDFNLPGLAACNFCPSHRQIDYTEAFDGRKETKNQLYSAFWAKFDLINHVHEPSRATSYNTLDLLINSKSDEPPQFKVDRYAFDGMSDHYPLFFTIQVRYTTEETINIRRQTHPKNLGKLLKRLEDRQLQDYCPTDTGDNIITYIQNEVKYAYEKECPYVEVKPPPRRGYLSKDSVHHMRQCNRIKNSIKNGAYNEAQYLSIKQKLKTMKKYTKFMCKRDRIHNDIRKFETSAKKKKNFYKHCKKRKSKSSKIGPILASTGNIISSNSEITTEFGSHLGTQLKPELSFAQLLELQERCLAFRNLPGNMLNASAIPYPDWTGGKQYPDWFTPHPDSPDQLLTHKQTYVSPRMVVEQIRKAKRGSAPGPDDIPMLVYSVAAKLLAPMLAVAFNLINQSGIIPISFRVAKVKLLFKKKDKTDMNNYRPLSMSNHIGKIWERCINSLIINHLEVNKLLSENQEGFRPHRGT